MFPFKAFDTIDRRFHTGPGKTGNPCSSDQHTSVSKVRLTEQRSPQEMILSRVPSEKEKSRWRRWSRC